MHDNPADGVEFPVGNVDAEALAEILDPGQCQHGEAPAAVIVDVFGFLRIVFVVNVADDLLDDVFDGGQARHAAVFVDHDGHVIVAFPELGEQRIQAFALGDVDDRAENFGDLNRVAGVILPEITQQVLGQHDAGHLVAVLAHHRKPGMARIDDGLEHGLGRIVQFQHHHVRAGHHDVPHLGLGNLQDPLEHGMLIGFQEIDAPAPAEKLDNIGSRHAVVGGSPEQTRPPPGTAGRVSTGGKIVGHR